MLLNCMNSMDLFNSERVFDMTGYVPSAVFVYTQESENLLEHLRSNGSGTRITAVEFDTFEQDPDAMPEGVGHVVVAGSLDVIKAVIGRLPVLDSPGNVKLRNVITRSRNRLKGLKLLGFQFTTGGKKKINTAACLYCLENLVIYSGRSGLGVRSETLKYFEVL